MVDGGWSVGPSSILWAFRLWWFRTFRMRGMPVAPLTPVTGYVYVGMEDVGPMAGAAPGAVIRNPTREPPWIVIHFRLGGVLVVRWPGRLWYVEVLEPVTEADPAARPVPSAGYVRSLAVRVLREVPAEELFGRYGGAVCKVIEAGERLTEAQAIALAAARHPDASAANLRTWHRWLACESDGVPAGHAGTEGSPINRGPSVLSNAVFRRAEALGGEAATTFEEEDGVFVLVAPWSEADHALLDAALAFGAPEMAGEDRAVLTQAWREVFGPGMG